MRLTILLFIMLGGCAMSSHGAMKKPITRTYTSHKPAADVAACIAAGLGGIVIPGAGEHIVQVKDMFGDIFAQWNVRPTETGSVTDYRRVVGLMDNGRSRYEPCF